jgi:hypothetical protein
MLTNEKLIVGEERLHCNAVYHLMRLQGKGSDYALPLYDPSMIVAGKSGRFFPRMTEIASRLSCHRNQLYLAADLLVQSGFWEVLSEVRGKAVEYRPLFHEECFGLHGDVDVKAGQIAHLDHDNKNNEADNLAFLCLNHHDQYDSKTSQSKGLREDEIKQFRTDLYNNVGAALSQAEEKFLKLFGNDNEGVEPAEWFKRLQDTALTQTASVQCLGMRNPLPFDSIYQPTRVIVAPDEDDTSTESYVWGDRASRSILRGRAFNENRSRLTSSYSVTRTH